MTGKDEDRKQIPEDLKARFSRENTEKSRQPLKPTEYYLPEKPNKSQPQPVKQDPPPTK